MCSLCWLFSGRRPRAVAHLPATEARVYAVAFCGAETELKSQCDEDEDGASALDRVPMGPAAPTSSPTSTVIVPISLTHVVLAGAAPGMMALVSLAWPVAASFGSIRLGHPRKHIAETVCTCVCGMRLSRV